MRQHVIYQGLSQYYDLVFGPLLERGRRQIGELVQKEPISELLELGAGSGLSLKYYPSNIKVHAVDISQEMLDKIQENNDSSSPHVIVKQGDATSLDYPQNHFAMTVCQSILSVVPNPQALVKEAIRVTRPGGKIIFMGHFRTKSLPNFVFSTLTSPLTKLFLSFQMKVDENIFGPFSDQVTVLEKIPANFLGPWPLNTIVVLQKSGQQTPQG